MMAPNPNPDLFTGAKTAIGVVVPLFVFAVVGLAERIGCVLHLGTTKGNFTNAIDKLRCRSDLRVY
jgi:hypothetical protein